MDTTHDSSSNGLDPDDMAEFTKRDAAGRSREDREATGSHDFAADTGSGDDPAKPLGQLGAGQSDDVHGLAPAAGMARQHANPANQRDAPSRIDTGGAGAADEAARD